MSKQITKVLGKKPFSPTPINLGYVKDLFERFGGNGKSNLAEPSHAIRRITFVNPLDLIKRSEAAIRTLIRDITGAENDLIVLRTKARDEATDLKTTKDVYDDICRTEDSITKRIDGLSVLASAEDDKAKKISKALKALGGISADSQPAVVLGTNIENAKTNAANMREEMARLRKELKTTSEQRKGLLDIIAELDDSLAQREERIALLDAKVLSMRKMKEEEERNIVFVIRKSGFAEIIDTMSSQRTMINESMQKAINAREEASREKIIVGNENMRLRAEYAQLKTANAQMEAAITNGNAELKRLGNQFMEVQQRARLYDEANARLELVRGEIEAKNAEIEGLKDKAAQLTTTLYKIEGPAADGEAISALKLQMQAIEEQKTALETDLRAEKEKVAALLQDRATTGKAMDRQRTQLETAGITIQEHLSKINALMNAGRRLKTDYDNQKGEISRLGAKIQELTASSGDEKLRTLADKITGELAAIETIISTPTAINVDTIDVYIRNIYLHIEQLVPLYGDGGEKEDTKTILRSDISDPGTATETFPGPKQ